MLENRKAIFDREAQVLTERMIDPFLGVISWSKVKGQ